MEGDSNGGKGLNDDETGFNGSDGQQYRWQTWGGPGGLRAGAR